MVQSMWYPPITKQSNVTFDLPSCMCIESSAGSCDSCFNNCLCPQCEAVNCCCIEIKVRQPSMGSFTLQRTTTSSPNYPPRDTFSPPAHVIGQENLLPSSPTSRVVTAQMHVNRAFDNTLAACEGQMEVKGTGNSKLKQNKLMKERNDTAEDFRHVQVKRRKAQEKTDLSAANDKRAPLKENSGKEIRSNKRPRRNKTSSGPELNRSELVPGEKVTKAQPKHRSELVPGEKLTKAQPKHRSELVPGEKVTKAQPKHRSELVPGEKVTKAQPKHRSELVPGEKVTKAQPKQSSLVKSHTSQCNHSYKKVTWRNQPSKPTDPKSAQAREF
ncbi:uncharacterized protein LOC125672005 isoform X2 [Ostrea edulis]|uniref:uncharacterized protein LOC125672005 isoform X2 n=1 Tax=Ostrea edulis TaxID=37623 RepID=UPI0024AF4676|nr:uncharacterized protein LOC125672005 isoform X2 [Ostrea edulis]